MSTGALESITEPEVDQPGRRRLLRGLPCLLVPLPAGWVHAQDEFGDAGLRGAGSTFVQPLMEEWFRQYRADPYQLLQGMRPQERGLGDLNSHDSLDYEAVGSLAGIQRIQAGLVDFAASEMPISDEHQKRSGLIQFPWTAGGVAVVHNGGAPRLDAATLAGIYLGRIKLWSDPAIQALNPGVVLPDAEIVTVHREDGSGTTYTLASYLSATRPEWRDSLGADLLLKWPGGVGAKGGSALIERVRGTPHSIGYVNAAQARRAGVAMVALRNRAGAFVAPDAASVAAALAQAGPADAPERLPLDAGGDGSYPVVATVFGLLRGPIGSRRQRRTSEFVRWTLAGGGSIGERLGYSRLSAQTVKEAMARLEARA